MRFFRRNITFLYTGSNNQPLDSKKNQGAVADFQAVCGHKNTPAAILHIQNEMTLVIVEKPVLFHFPKLQ